MVNSLYVGVLSTFSCVVHKSVAAFVVPASNTLIASGIAHCTHQALLGLRCFSLVALLPSQRLATLHPNGPFFGLDRDPALGVLLLVDASYPPPFLEP